MSERGGKRRRGWRAVVDRVAAGAQNALEIARMGRLTEPYRAEFDVRHQERRYRLRRYKGQRVQNAADRPILLVPPLMVLMGELTRLSVWLVHLIEASSRGSGNPPPP